MTYPSVHGGSGFSVQHRTTKADIAPRICGELSDRHWNSFRDAGEPVPNVWHPHFILDFWRNCFDFHRSFYREVISASPLVRMAKGLRSS
jgi:hypothetical protein